MKVNLRAFWGCVWLGFWESLRQRVLAGLAIFLAIAFVIAILGRDLSVGQDVKLVKDIGLAVMELIAVFFGLVGGSSVIAREVEQRSFYFVLSRPTSRASFVVGKFTGMAVAQAVNLIGLLIVLCAALTFIRAPLDLRLGVAALGIGFQALLAAAIALMFSVFTSPTIAMAGSLSCYIAGRWSDIIRNAREIAPDTPQFLWDALYLALPNYRYMDFKALAIYGDMVSPGHLATVAAYAACYVAIALSITVLRFERRDLR